MTPLLLLLATASAAAVGTEADRRLVVDNLRLQAEVWLQTGVLDESEADRYFRTEWNLEADLATMRDRAAEITEKTPPATDLCRLPSRDYARQSWTATVYYGRYLDWIRPWAAPNERVRIDAAEADLAWRRRVWGLIDDIRGGWRREGPRLLLGQLRDLVGEDAYLGGDWPDPLPPTAYWFRWEDPPPEPLPDE